MHTGKVKNWDPVKGYGFIISAEEDELFVHSGDLHVSVKGKRLFEGQEVKYDIRRDMKGDKAVNVRVVK
jgi:CspA family cold shock protein